MSDSSRHIQDERNCQLGQPRPPDFAQQTTRPNSTAWHSTTHHSPLSIPRLLNSHPPPSLPSLSRVLNTSPAPYSSSGGGSAYPARTSYPRLIEPTSRVGEFLTRLELSEYTNVLVNEGFDRMETLMDIQEEDLIALSVKRGHRRRLQRELAWLRGVPHTTPLNVLPSSSGAEVVDEAPIAPPQPQKAPQPVQQINKNVFHLSSSRPISASNPISTSQSYQVPPPRVTGKPSIENPKHEIRANPISQTPTATGSPLPNPTLNPQLTGTKRRYRRHPKPDANAPVKPVSAFVTFSSNLRNEDSLKDKTFAEMSVLVGERWQALPKAVKEALETRASDAKETYAADMAAYKYTKQFADYEEYLRDFRLKNGLVDDAAPSASHSRSTSVELGQPRLAGRGSADTLSLGPRVKRERSEDDLSGPGGSQSGRDQEDELENDTPEVGWEEQAAAARVLSRARPSLGATGSRSSGESAGPAQA